MTDKELMMTSNTMKQVLYVEDNDTNRLLMKAIFNRQKNYKLTMVDTGEHGWDIALQQSFDLVLMDINLPGMGGVELTKKLRLTESYKDIPIIAVSAAAMKHDIESTQDLFESYITKPIQIDLFIKKLDEYLS